MVTKSNGIEAGAATAAGTVSGPDFLALQVADLEGSARFYTEVVGLTRAAHGPPDAVVFRTRPIPFAIRRPLVDLSLVAGRVGWGVALWFACDDADALYTRLAAAGVPVTAPPADGPFGRHFTFRDPDGYALTVHGPAPTRRP